MTLEASRLTVLAMTAPQPSLKAREMTLRFVPGGPEPMTKGFGSLRPSTVVANVGMVFLSVSGLGKNLGARGGENVRGGRRPESYCAGRRRSLSGAWTG